jgi:hypothetical protein
MAAKRIIILLTVMVVYSFMVNNVKAEEKIIISIEYGINNEDIIAQKLIYELKEAIRRSSSLALSANRGERVELSILAVDPLSKSKELSGIVSSYCTVLLLYKKINNVLTPLYVKHNLSYCVKGKEKETAEKIVAQTDNFLRETEKKIK